jgi:hypothetical protein
MPKSLVGQLLGLYTHILKDIACLHPNLRKGFDRDLSRLESLAGNHGERVFTLLLPALGKIFDLSLEQGVLSTNGEPLTRPINSRTTIPRLFGGMWSLFFQNNGCLKQDISPDDVRLMRTLLFVVKKYEMECAPEATFAAIKEYYDVDQSLPPASSIWRGAGDDLAVVRSWSLLDLPALQPILGQPVSTGDTRELLALTQRIGDRVSSLLGEFSPSDARFRHGPGAVSDLRTGLAYKYAFPNWSPRLSWMFPADEFAHANLRQFETLDDWHTGRIPSQEPASKLCVVPKTQKAPRLIAAEPTCNQWAQQSVRSFLTDAIRRQHKRGKLVYSIGDSIDFSRQDLSGELALSSSLTREYATVDLSAASDRLSCWLIERLFRANYSLLSAFVASRTRFLTNDIDKKSPKLVELRKFASMGSALTFPVQSLAFLILCLSAGVYAEGMKESDWPKLLRRVRVYGDDLIVPVLWMPVVEVLLSTLYLKINRSKTFVKGNFRESCGTDAYMGHNVSPGQVRRFYDESAVGTLQGVVDSSNNLFDKGFFSTALYLLTPVPIGIKKLIPWVGIGSDSFGLKTSSGFATTSRKRWNKHLHFWEYETLRFRSKRTSATRAEGFENLLQYFTEDPSSQPFLTDWESGLFSKAVTVASRGWEQVPNQA